MFQTAVLFYYQGKLTSLIYFPGKTLIFEP